MPFEDNDPAPTLPLGVTARQFSACYNLNGIASRLIYSFTQFNQFINQLSYSVVPAPFQVHVPIIYPQREKVKRMFTYFPRKIKIFSELSTIPKGRSGTANKTMPQLYNERPPAAKKKAIRKRVSADAFSRRAFLSLRIFFLVPPVWYSGFIVPFERLCFGCFRRELVCGGAKRRRTRL